METSRGYADVRHFRGLMDSMEHCHVIWSSYEHRRDVTPFQDVFWCSRWIMAGKQKIVCHLPKRVLRQYGYVQTIPRPFVSPAPVPEYIAPRPVYQEVIVEQEWPRHPPDPLQVISSMRARVEHALKIP
jgi:hypothetical protein